MTIPFIVPTGVFISMFFAFFNTWLFCKEGPLNKWSLLPAHIIGMRMKEFA